MFGGFSFMKKNYTIVRLFCSISETLKMTDRMRVGIQADNSKAVLLRPADPMAH